MWATTYSDELVEGSYTSSMKVGTVGRFVCCLALSAALWGCSCDDGDPADGGDAMVNPDGSIGFDSTVVGPMCTMDNECAPEVCHSVSMTCVDAGDECSAQSECTGGTYCADEKGVCLPGTPGSPCESEDNCTNGCRNGMCGCAGLVQEAQLESGSLDVFLVLDKTGSMRSGMGSDGDCEYEPETEPTAPVDSKACYATYAVNDYLINVSPQVDTRLAFHFMSYTRGCNGDEYIDPELGLTQLPFDRNDALIQAISDEDFSGGTGTRIEGALNGIARFTRANETDGREMIGVLVTDGNPQGCEENIGDLADIISAHLEDTGIRTFIIGMEGADERSLERLAQAGGAEPHDDYCGGIDPPCHYWNVGDGSGTALADALTAISAQAAPIPCELDITGLQAPPGEAIDYGKINVTFNEGNEVQTIGQVPSSGDCPGDVQAWHYDDAGSPTSINLCPLTCDLVTNAGNGARVDVVVGCNDTVTIR